MKCHCALSNSSATFISKGYPVVSNPSQYFGLVTVDTYMDVFFVSLIESSDKTFLEWHII